MGKRNKDTDYPEQYGDQVQYDPTFKGPLGRRSCTDIICLALFLVFCVAWVAVGIIAFKDGDPNRILVPTESTGRKCGVDLGVEDKPYLYIFDLTKCININPLNQGCNTPQVCVQQCPNETFIGDLDIGNTVISAEDIQRKLICLDDFDKTSIVDKSTFDAAWHDNKCGRIYIKSESVAQRCLPLTKELTDQAKRLGEIDLIADQFKEGSQASQLLTSVREIGDMIVNDLTNSWPLIVGGLAIAMAVCLIYIVLMRWLAGFMVWFSLFGVMALLAYCCYASYVKYAELRDKGDEPTDSTGSSIGDQAQAVLALKETWLVFLIAAAITLAIVLVITIFLRKRIRIAVALIQVASRAVSNMISTLAFPLLPWALELGVIAWSVGVGLYLASSGEAVYRVTAVNTTICSCGDDYEPNSICNPNEFKTLNCTSVENPDDPCINGIGYASCNFFRFETDSRIIYMHIYNIFGFFWGLCFVSALGEMILAGAFATWYWTFNKSDVPFFTLTASAGRTLRYHLGTLAFGSLILAICQMIRVILEYISAKLRKYDNCLVKAILCCLKCFFWCLENFIRFINRNAYIMCAIHGKNFCRSAKDAFKLLMRNMLRVFVLDKVTEYLLFLGKLLITAGMVALSFYIFSDTFDTPQEIEDVLEVPKLNYYFIPVIIIGFGTYIIASLFFGVYAMAVDTLFLCFLEDLERNDGSLQKPYFMSKKLMKVLGKKNKKEKKEKKVK